MDDGVSFTGGKTVVAKLHLESTLKISEAITSFPHTPSQRAQCQRYLCLYLTLRELCTESIEDANVQHGSSTKGKEMGIIN
jgi:hypothetical protein